MPARHPPAVPECAHTALVLAALSVPALELGCAPDQMAPSTTSRDLDAAHDVRSADSHRDALAYSYPLPFLPSNVSLGTHDFEGVGDVTVDAPDCAIDADAGTWPCVPASLYQHTVFQYANGWKQSIFVVKSLTVAAGGVLTARGSETLAVVAANDLTVLGAIRIPPGTLGGGTTSSSNQQGGGSGGGVMAGPNGGANGASFCGQGGIAAARPGATAGLSLQPYGLDELSPLLAGSAGGSGAVSGTGAGGGAIQLVAGGTLRLAGGAVITAPGGGGAAGVDPTHTASGGGSGGAILIEASSVVLQGVLAANGGGGGEGIGDPGEDGNPSAAAASGGAKNAVSGGRGGDGNSASNASGMNGALGTAAGNPPGGGGGGAGRIRINTKSGPPDLTNAVVSPSPATGCTTFGTIQ